MTKQNSIFVLLISLLATACCKVSMEFQKIDKINFVGFNLSEIDTFYAIPIFKDSVIAFQNYNDYLETTTSMNSTLTKTVLSQSNKIQIVLKDTSVRYNVETLHTTSFRTGKGRCAGSFTIIDSFKVRNKTFTGNVIIIEK